MTAAAPSPKPPALARYGALSLTYFAAIGLFNPYAPLWFQSLGFSTLAIGGLASLQSWTRVFAPYAWSWCGDHSGRSVELIRLAAAGALLSALGLLGVQSAVPVAAVVACLFIANSGVVPLSEAMLAHLLHTADGVDPGRYGRVRMWGSVGFIAAVLPRQPGLRQGRRGRAVGGERGGRDCFLRHPGPLVSLADGPRLAAGVG